MRKRILFACIFCFLTVFVRADDPVTLTTTDGKTITGSISRVEPDCLVIITDSGISRIPFTELSAEVRAKYGYDPQKAAAHAVAVAAAQAQIYQQAQASKADQASANLAANIDMAHVSDDVEKKRVAARAIRENEALQNRGISLLGKVIQRTKDGLLVHSTASPFKGDLWIVGYDAPEESRISIKVEAQGTKDYTTLDGAERMIDQYRFVKENSTPQ